MKLLLLSCESFILFFFFFWWDWSLNSGLLNYKAGALPLEHTSSPLYSGYFGHGVLQTE
jgi:hypothetical protein